MLRPRWKKVLSDLWSSKARTALVVVSIFIGVFATGVISGTRSIVVNELKRSYQNINPATTIFRFRSVDSFDEDLLNTIKGVKGVTDVEGRSSTTVSLETEPDTWADLQLTTISNLKDIQINQLHLVKGDDSLSNKGVMIERSSMVLLNKSVGDSLSIELSDGTRKTMHITGIVHDLDVRPTNMTGTYYGYISLDTMEWLGESRDYTQMLVRISATETPEQAQVVQAAPGTDGRGTSSVMQIVEAINLKIQKSGREMPPMRGPGGGVATEHWATGLVSNLSIMMNVLGIMSLFLSGFLVTNTISALLAQQTRQIGIMKAIGARTSQMIGMYMVLVICFGILAILLAVPLTLSVTNMFVSIIANYFNFDLSGASFPINILLMQSFASLLIPVIASLPPVISGTRVTVLQAINSEGIHTRTIKRKKKRRFNIFFFMAYLVPLGNAIIRVLKRPMILAIRNTFRRKTRVALTLLTLAVGGLIFTGIFTIRSSLRLTLNDFIAKEFQFDMVVMLERSYPDYEVIDNVLQVPGIAVAEAWTEGSGNRIYDNGTESEDIRMSGVPPDSKMLDPTVVSGRWLLPEDENAIVITTGVLEDDPDITVGSKIRLNIDDEPTTWQVVGITTGIGTSREAYVNYSYFSRVLHTVGKVSNVRVRFADTLPVEESAMADLVETHLERKSIGVGRVFAMSEMLSRVLQQFDFIVIALLIMAMLIAVVGGLGLAGTMSLNVIERTREIGIMRAIGASDGMILQIFLGEGLVIGLLSWFIGTGLSLPLSKLLSDAMGNLFFRLPLSFQFSIGGMIGWLTLSVVLAVVSSFVPAWNATRLSVRSALSYE